MTLTEQYNKYVKECIKERPAFSGPYEDYYLEFDEWIYNYMTEFTEWCVKYRDKNKNVNGEMLHSISKYDDTYLTKELLEIFKKEKGL
jgi:hypothetical protein